MEDVVKEEAVAPVTPPAVQAKAASAARTPVQELVQPKLARFFKSSPSGEDLETVRAQAVKSRHSPAQTPVKRVADILEEAREEHERRLQTHGADGGLAGFKGGRPEMSPAEKRCVYGEDCSNRRARGQPPRHTIICLYKVVTFVYKIMSLYIQLYVCKS